MGRPSLLEWELIEKIARTKMRLEGLKRSHPDHCPVNDPHMAGDCTCGADEHNSKIVEILTDLENK